MPSNTDDNGSDEPNDTTASDGTSPAADADSDAYPDAVHWRDEDRTRGVVEIEFTRGEIEWIALEADEHDMDFREWIRAELWADLRVDFEEEHSIEETIRVDLPEDLLERVRCWQADRDIKGKVTIPMDDILDTFVELDRVYHVGGEPLRDTLPDDALASSADLSRQYNVPGADEDIGEGESAAGQSPDSDPDQNDTNPRDESK